MEWNWPLAINDGMFNEVDKENCILYVPKGTAIMYRSAPEWMKFVNIVEYETENDEFASIAQVSTKSMHIKNERGNLTIEGADDGEKVHVYTTNGVQTGSAVSRNGKAVVGTNLQKGEIAIVKVGEKSVKVVVK